MCGMVARACHGGKIAEGFHAYRKRAAVSIDLSTIRYHAPFAGGDAGRQLGLQTPRKAKIGSVGDGRGANEVNVLAGNESVYHRRAFREFGERCARGMSLSIRIGWGGKLDTDPGYQGAPKVTGRTEVPPGGPVGCATRHGRRKEGGGGKG